MKQRLKRFSAAPPAEWLQRLSAMAGACALLLLAEPGGAGEVRTPQPGAREDGHWAFAPVTKPSLPPPAEAAPTEIDRFIVAALKARGLSLSPVVPRWQWIRRATFDLTGLPPTWEEVGAFVEDRSPDAPEKVI